VIASMKEFSSIYMWKMPNLYFISIQYLLQLNSMYFAFWCTNYVVLPHYSSNEILWQFLSILPLFLIVPLLALMIKTSSVLKAISMLDPEVVGRILEDDENTLKSAELIKTKVLDRLENSTEVTYTRNPLERISELFMEFGNESVNEGYTIDSRAFTKVLTMLQLHFTKKKLNAVFNFIDKDLSGSITENEFFAFIYHVEAKVQDMQEREKTLNKAESQKWSSRSGSTISRMGSFLGSSMHMKPKSNSVCVSMEVGVNSSSEEEVDEDDNRDTFSDFFVFPHPQNHHHAESPNSDPDFRPGNLLNNEVMDNTYKETHEKSKNSIAEHNGGIISNSGHS